jgi:Tfp pilus assembly protein PilV
MRGPMATTRPIRKSLRIQSGFSLVEVVVAACILGLTISAIIAMIGNSDLLRASNDHNRQARIIAQEELEDTRQHFLNYGTMDPVSAPISLDFGEKYGEQDVKTVPAFRDVTASGQVSKEIFGDGVFIPYKTVRSKVTWTEPGGAGLSVELKKRITNLP